MPSSFRYDKTLRKEWERAEEEGRAEQFRLETAARQNEAGVARK